MNNTTGHWLQMNQSTLRNNQFKFKASRKLPIHLEKSQEFSLYLMRISDRCQHVTGCSYNAVNNETYFVLGLGSVPYTIPIQIGFHQYMRM